MLIPRSSPVFQRLVRPVGIGHRLSSSVSTAAEGTRSKSIKIVEVSPRDGLQNETRTISTKLKLELIERLVDAGCRTIECGALVSPKWVPQMADTESVLRQLHSRKKDVSFPVLVPNGRGLDKLLTLLGGMDLAPTNEIAIFTAATDSFTLANTNSTVRQSLDRCAEVARRAIDAGFKVRGYVSVIAVCPYEGRVAPERVAQVAKEVLDMGCYEVSLGDTTGAGTPDQVRAILNACIRAGVPLERIAGHCHNTFGTALANVLALSEAGVRTFDSSVASLGGCPYSPGATGNVDTESLVYAFHQQGYETGINLAQLVRTGQWISDALGRPNASLAGRALLAREQAKSKL